MMESAVMQSSGLIYTLLLLSIVAFVIVAYSIRVMTKGRAQFDRVDRQGGSPLLSKSIMEMGYWSLQPVARLLIFFHITPNMLSWTSFAFGLIAAICLGVGHFGSGAVFAAISFLMDALDGMVARLTGTMSPAGVVLDSSLDRYVEFFFLSGLVFYYRHIPVMQIIALAALLGSFMVSYSTAKAEALHIEPPKGSMKRPERAFYLTLGAALSPVTIPWLEVYREFQVPIAHPMVVALCLVAVLANVSAAERLVAVGKGAKLRHENQLREQRRIAEAKLAVEEREEEPVHLNPPL